MGVGCKLLPFVVYCLFFVMMSTNTEKNSAVSEQGHVLTAYVFFPWSKLSQYADQELLKSLSQDTTPDLSFILDPSAWPAGSEVRIKEYRPKGKIMLKTETKHKKNGTIRKQKTASRSPGVEPSWSASSASNSLTTAPQWHTLFKKLILSYLNNFSLP